MSVIIEELFENNYLFRITKTFKYDFSHDIPYAIAEEQFLNGKLHSENSPACINKWGVKYRFWNKSWYFNGTLHRSDGPALENAGGYKEWFIHGKRHRLDGPAIEEADGSKFWYVEDERIDCDSQEEFERLIKLKAFW